MLNQKEEFPRSINGIWFEDQEGYNKRLQQDVQALANLLYDIYSDKKYSNEGISSNENI